MVDQLVSRAQEVLSPDKSYREKMAAFIQFISEMMAPEGRLKLMSPCFTASSDLRNNSEIKQIRDSAQDRMANLLLGLVQ